MPDQDYITISTELQRVITTDQAWYYRIVPKKEEAGKLELYIDSLNYKEDLKEELEILFGKEIFLQQISSEVIHKTLSFFYRKGKNYSTGKKGVNFHSDDFLLLLIDEANSLGSSDIHIETYNENCRIRLRIDGKLIERYIIQKEEYPSLINKIKIKANLDIAEKRLPQDGRIFFTNVFAKFDIRVSVLPTLYGEKVVLRLLSKDATNIEISELGFLSQQLADYYEGIKKPYGIVLISGPTGSGKTTTLYATLKILNKENTNILTIEDPIEYTLDGINQVQVKENIGLTFASTLRTFLRQDPDIIMLGEIRDNETAQMAVRAALTGHLVLSTIHTNSAWGTISRLIDMQVPSFLLANTLNISVAQRLVRLLCPNCKKEESVTKGLLPKNIDEKLLPSSHFVAVGCDQCFFTGYKGRKAVYEVIPMDSVLAEKIKAVELDVSYLIKERGIKTLSESVMELLEKGLTSIEEAYPILTIDSL